MNKFEKRRGHLELNQSESIVNQWTLAQKVLGLAKLFGRAHQTRRKVREHMNEPKKTANPIPRHRQKTMSRIKKMSHADAYRFFNLLTFFKNFGPEQKIDQRQDEKGRRKKTDSRREIL